IVSVSIDDAPASGTPVMRVECGGDESPAAAPPRDGGVAPLLRLAVVKGQCDRGEYTFDGGGITIGRGTEPADAFGRVRRNDIAFADLRDSVSETVARAHARIEFDAAVCAYLLFNESATNPTFLLRHGRSLRVPARDPRGVRLQPGDELQLGRAVLKVTVAEVE